MEIRFGPRIDRAIRDHGAETYPHECCGAMLGVARPDGKEVRRVLRIENARTDSARNRFLVTDDDYRRVEQEAAVAGLDLLGFYHSHPDHPAEPSSTDLAHALPWFSYVIVAVAGGNPEKMTSWVLTEDRSRFVEEDVTAIAVEDSRGSSDGGF